ncbi:hypothetical protein GEV33_004241 [Tenebrio molitor]|uniref:Uncharacterized protein n=1 Tax=Tenebrio molitor TaxID=7067 RepID=A0A8J6HPT5_TENMO|nr:hypothetical protein GEV33_004241 [Tenebrio molitor]
MHASQHQHLKVNLILRRYHQQKQQHDNIRSGPITRFSSGMGINKMQSNGDVKKNKSGLIPVTTLESSAPESLKAGLKCSVICTNCSGTCDNSQVASQDSDEEEQTETIFEQTYDEIENEEDCDENDNPIADDVEEISVCDVSIAPHVLRRKRGPRSMNRAPRADQNSEHDFRLCKRFDTLYVIPFRTKDRCSSTIRETFGPGVDPPQRDEPAPFFANRGLSSEEFSSPRALPPQKLCVRSTRPSTTWIRVVDISSAIPSG